jgi:hypothetical protein
MTELYAPNLGKHPALIPVSNSEIGTFKECKRKWWLNYYSGLTSKNEKVIGPLALGTRIHKCLEDLYTLGVHPVDTHARLVGEVRQELLALDLDPAAFNKDADLGQIMLEGYMEWLEETGADSDLEVIGAEKKLSVPIFDGKVELRGKVDLRVRRKADNVRLMLDFKTVANKDLYMKTAHMAEQLKLYLLLENMTEDEHRIDGARYRFLKKVKRTAKATGPFYEDVDIRHNKTTLNNYWLSLHGVVQGMIDLRQQLDNGADPMQVAYPTPSNDCTWKCPFYTACPMFDDGSAVDEYIDDNFKKNDPYERYEEEVKIT